MPVIAVINRKGGSGKSTLATHLAAYCANNGMRVMLGDVDKQQSSQGWLKLRKAQPVAARAPILGWTVDPRNVLHRPAGVTHTILDTPGGMTGFDLARLVMVADAILIPLCNSVFDRNSAADCYAELKAMPRVTTGRCRVAAVGMRIDARTRAGETLRQWANAQQLPFVGVLRETQAYVRCIERGLTLFDLPAAQVQADMAQWQPILDWLGPVLRDEVNTMQAAERSKPAKRAATVSRAIPESLLAAGARGDTQPAGAPARNPVRPAAPKPLPVAKPTPRPSTLVGRVLAAQSPGLASRVGRLLDSLQIGRFLKT
jgi:chromosome partitioning protein